MALQLVGCTVQKYKSDDGNYLNHILSLNLESIILLMFANHQTNIPESV